MHVHFWYGVCTYLRLARMCGRGVGVFPCKPSENSKQSTETQRAHLVVSSSGSLWSAWFLRLSINFLASPLKDLRSKSTCMGWQRSHGGTKVELGPICVCHLGPCLLLQVVGSTYC